MITTLTPTQTVQAQVLETISPDQITDEVTKDVISQFLPQRKRKQRVNKKPVNSVGTAVVSAGGNNNAKVIKTEEENTIQTIIVNSAEEVLTTTEIKKEQITPQQQIVTTQQIVEPTITTTATTPTPTTTTKTETTTTTDAPVNEFKSGYNCIEFGITKKIVSYYQDLKSYMSVNS